MRRAAGPLMWRYVLIVAVNALVLFVLIPAVADRFAPLYNQNVYADGYDQLAGNLAAGAGYRFYPDTAPTLMREPGYPVFLAGIFRLAGNSFAAVKLANLCLALIAAWVMTRIARRVSTSRLVILGAPLVFLFHPGTLIAEGRGGVEMLFILLLTVFLLTVYRAIERKRISDFVISGAVLGLTVLVRSTPMLFPLVLLAYLVVFSRRGQSRLVLGRNVAVMILTMLAVMSPWIIRNYRLTGAFVPTASVLGVSAHAGQYLCTHISTDNRWVDLDRQAARERTRLASALGYRFKDVSDGYYQLFYSSTDELRFSSYLLQNVVAEYERSPMLLVKCAGFNLFNIWFAGKTWTSTGLNLALQLPFLMLAGLGVVLAVRADAVRLIAPLLLFLAYYVAVYAPILAQARYSVPLIPCLSVLAGLGLTAARPRFAGLFGTVPGVELKGTA